MLSSRRASAEQPFTSAPGPALPPVLGTLPTVVRFGRDPLRFAGELFRRFGPLVAMVRGPVRVLSPRGHGVVLATGPDLNREVLTEHDRYHSIGLAGTYYPNEDELAASPRIGRATPERLRPVSRTLTGLLHVNGDEHRRQRRLLMPAFQKTRIDAYRDDMIAIVEDMLSGWHPGELRDVHAEMTELTLRIATKTLFGEDAGARGVALARKMQSWLDTMFSVGMLLRIDLGAMPYRRWLDLTHEMDAETLAIIRAKRARLASQESGDRDVLSVLVSAHDEDGSALDEDELVGHTGLLFAAGHETSTNALAWTLFLLSQHPDVACDLADELAGLLHGDAPTVDQLGQLPLLDAVVKESMRVLPPVPLHPRLANEDSELGGHFLPKNTELFLSIFHIHHDPAVFARPEVFDPSRWERSKPTAFEYNPFGAGPRMCIGASFAMMEIKLTLAMLLQRFRVEMPEHARVDPRVMITMAPKGGMPMRLRPADRAWGAGPRNVRGGVRDLVELPR